MPETSVPLRQPGVGPDRAAASKPGRDAGCVKVLLVEDDDIDAKLIGLYADAMSAPSVVIERAVSTGEARRLLAERPFDLCILDFWLGCESSLRLLADLDSLQPGLPAVMLTSLSTPDIRRMCRQAGAAGFIGKQEIGSDSLRTVIHDALRAAVPPAPAQESSEDALARLLGRLLDTVDAGEDRDLGSSAAADQFRQRLMMRARLAGLLDMTETMRFGLFEKVLAARPSAGRSGEAARIDDVGAFMASVIEIARGVVDGRGQTVSFLRPDRAIGFACDPATLFFLVFELVGHASQQSASNGRIQVWLRAEGGLLRMGVASQVPTNANAGAVALGPLFAQIVCDLQGALIAAAGPDGRLDLEARFTAASGVESGLTH